MKRYRLRRRQALQVLALPVLATLGPGASRARSDGARWLPWLARRPTPPTALPDLDGAPWSPGQEAGKPVLLNFWASWCEPCRAEMQSFVALQQHFSAAGLKVVAVNFKESADTVRRFREANPWPFVWLRDSYGEAARAWGVRTFPSSVLLDRKGQALLMVEGEVDWADAAVHARLAALL